MADLLVLVPTRGRRANAERLIAACQATGATSDFLLITDDDDHEIRGLLGQLPDRWDFTVDPPDCLSGKLNTAAARYGQFYDAIAFLSDDQVPLTPAWDTALKAALGDMRGGWAYPADGQRADIPQSVAISTEIVHALGWFACPALDHYWLDNAWADLARATGRLRYLPDVLIPARPGPDDATRIGALASGDHDINAYNEWKAGQLAADVATLRQLFGA